MLIVENLSYTYTDTQVLENIHFTLSQGEVLSIVGASGSGKSTLLKALYGLFDLSQGKIFWKGTPVLGPSHNLVPGFPKMKYLAQDFGLMPYMTVEENVMFPLQMFSKLSAAEMKDRVDFVLEKVNLVNAHHKKPSEISGGMQKRVAIARAVVNEPKYLFCDEPNSGLDPKTAIVIDNLIHTVTEEFNITTIINTHDMNSVMEIGEQIIFLKNGYKEWEGSKDTIFKTDNEAVTDFVYSSELFKKVRKMYLDSEK